MRKSNATNGDNLGTIGSRIRNLRKVELRHLRIPYSPQKGYASLL